VTFGADVASIYPGFRTARQPVSRDQRFTIGAIAGICGALLMLVLITRLLSGVHAATFAPMLASYTMLALWAGLIVCAVAQLAAVFTPGRWRLDLRAGWLLVAMLLSGVTLPLFQLFKQVVLPLRGFPLDPFLASFENQLLFGHDAWQITHALFGGLGATKLFDACYAVWLPMMFAFPPVIVMSIADIRLRARLLACWLASWVFIASLGAWLFGSAGPIYYNSLVGPNAGFAALQKELAIISATAQANGQSIAALDFQDMLLRQMKNGDLVSAGGISAMPSMHVAIATLMAIAAFRFAKPLGFIFTTYAILIWIGSIHLGWHYALDGVAGSAMMIGLWLITGKIVPQGTANS
jgi:PAP2 superfamily